MEKLVANSNPQLFRMHNNILSESAYHSSACCQGQKNLPLNSPSSYQFPEPWPHSTPVQSQYSLPLLLRFRLRLCHQPALLIELLNLRLAFFADGPADVVPEGGVELGVIGLESSS